jgi:uncharacterized protein
MLPMRSIENRIAGLDWPDLEAALNTKGYVTTPSLLTVDEARALAASYVQPDVFRSRVVMGQHGFGRGEYKYFRYPLPDLVGQLRQNFYPRLVALANIWNEAMGLAPR